MQKKKILVCLLAAALLLATLGLFVGCSGKVTYENAESYTAGDFDTDEKITAIEIYWQGGEVLLKNTISSKLYASEERDVRTDPQMYHAVADGVLRIYPCASGESVGSQEKALTLLLPYEYGNDLKSVRIVCEGDAQVMVDGVIAESLTVSTAAAPVILKGKLGTTSVTTTTGDLYVESMQAQGLTFRSNRGNATLSLQTSGFVAVIEGRGDFNSEYEAHRDGDVYRYGNQSLPMIFDTRGDVTLKQYEAK